MLRAEDATDSCPARRPHRRVRSISEFCMVTRSPSLSVSRTRGGEIPLAHLAPLGCAILRIKDGTGWLQPLDVPAMLNQARATAQRTEVN
jgi:hypothetical protein